VDAGQRLVLERNAGYWRKACPILDKITFEFGQEPIVALLRLQNGEVDVLGDGIPPAQFLEVMDDPAEGAQIVEGGQLQTGYVTMNTQAALRQRAVRQAVNMAINKDRIVRSSTTAPCRPTSRCRRRCPATSTRLRASPSIPRGPRRCSPRPAIADGFTTELFVMNTDPNPRIAQAIQQDLAAVGIKAEIQSLAQANVIAAGGDGSAPMIWSGGMAWIADFPDPSNFYGPILGCGGAVQGGWNWAWYCNEELDEKAAAADAIVDPAKAEERASRRGARSTPGSWRTRPGRRSSTSSASP
jgi:ABC-type transport system substrate-binding protein